MKKRGALTAFQLLTVLFLICAIGSVDAQMKKRVLFIGNSYTYVNNLPQIVADMAANTGDTLIYEMEAPGGSMLMDHYLSNPPTLAKIQAGNWDYMVLQEQSQAPALPTAYFQSGVEPYARKLDSFFHIYNPCGETIFYMTWGRKNGDAGYCATYAPQGWPYYCNYHQMDSIIRERYMTLASTNNSLVSPVGPVWHHIRNNYSTIDLYDPDQSHPSAAGSYAGGCSFYTAIFKKDPSQLTYNFSLSAGDAANIRTAAKKVAYDSMSYWHIGQYELNANFNYSTGSNYQVNFSNTSLNAANYSWDFGDGQTSTQPSTTHTYSSAGAYYVRLIASGGSCSDTMYQKINVPMGINNAYKRKLFSITRNITHTYITLSSKDFLSNTCTIQLMNNIGQTVLVSKNTATEQQEIDLSSLPPGNYILDVFDKGVCIYRDKIVKY